MIRGIAKVALLALVTGACDPDEQEADVQHTQETPGPQPADAPTDAGHGAPAPAADTGHATPAADSVAATTTH